MCSGAIERESYAEAAGPSPDQAAATVLARQERPADSDGRSVGGVRGALASYLPLITHLNDAAFIADTSCRVLHLNARCEQLMGYSAADLVGTAFPSLLAAGKRSFVEMLATSSEHGNEPRRLQIRHRAGAVLTVELSLSPILEGDELAGWLGIARDVTAQQGAELRLRSANRELSAIQMVLASAAQAIDLRAALSATLVQVLELLEAEAGAIFGARKQPRQLELLAHRGLSRSSVADLLTAPFRIGEGPLGQVADDGEAVLLDRTQGPLLIDFPIRDERLNALACVPLRAGSEIAGVIVIARRRDEPFSADELRTLTGIGNQAGMVIENTRLREEALDRARRFAALAEAAREIGKATGRGSVLSTIARAAAQVANSPAAAVMLRDDAGGLKLAAAHGLSGDNWREANLPAADTGMVGQLLDGRCAVLGELIAGSDAAAFQKHFGSLASVIAVPLKTNEGVFGAILAFQRVREAYDSVDVELLSCLSDLGVVAVERHRLLEEARRHAERAGVLSEINKAVVASLELEHVLKATAQQVGRLLEFDVLSVGIADEDSRSLELYTFDPGGRPALGRSRQATMADCALGWVSSNKRPLIRANLDTEAAFPWDGLLATLQLRSEVAVPLICHSRGLGSLGLESRQPGRYSETDAELLQQVAAQVSIAVENAKLYQQTRSDLDELAALREVVESFSADLDLDSLLKRIVAAASEYLRADNGSISLVNGDDGTLRIAATHNLPLERSRREMPVGEGIVGQVVASGQPVLAHSWLDSSGSGTERTDGSNLAVPIWWQGKLSGVFAVGSQGTARRFGTRDSGKLQLLAKHAAVAIENARLYGKGRESAVTEERNRLAREIHDTLAQSLTGLVLQLETVADLVHSSPSEASQELQEARELARRTLEEARQSVWALHPTPLQAMTLDQAIDKEMCALARQANLASYFAVKGDIRTLPPDTEIGLFRIAQEALNNIKKHARAHAVHGTLQYDEHEVRLVMQDDGAGIADSSAAPAGFGLTSMRERARLLGGQLQLASAPGQGTRLTVAIPYDSPAGTKEEKAEAELVSTSAPENTIKIVVADDHPIARQGIRRMLERFSDITIAGEAADGVEAIALSEEHQPDVVLMDLQMPRMNGVEAIAKLRETNPGAKVLIISTYDKDEFLFEGIKAGARGYLLKDVPADDLVRAIRAVSRGESLLQSVVAGKLLERFGRLARGEGGEDLTDREMEVLDLVAGGARNKEIARHLSIGEKTVKFHVANIFRKLRAGSRTEAMAIALERGIVRREVRH